MMKLAIFLLIFLSPYVLACTAEKEAKEKESFAYVSEFQEFKGMLSLSLNFPNEVESVAINNVYVHIEGVFGSYISFMTRWYYPDYSTSDISIREGDIDKVKIYVSYRESTERGVAFCGPNREYTLRELLNVNTPAKEPGPPPPPDF